MSREQSRSLNKKGKLTHNKKKIIDSDSESSSDSNDESIVSSSESEDNKLNIIEYRNLLSKLFPSKYMTNKVKSGKELKRKIKESILTKNKCDEQHSPKNAKTKLITSDESDDSVSSEVSTDTDYKKRKNDKVNIIFTIGSKPKSNEDYEEDSDNSEWEDDEDNESTEDEDEPIELEPSKDKTDTTDNSPEDNDEELLVQLKEIYSKNTNNKTIKECIETCENKIKDKQIKLNKMALKYKERNERIFQKIIKDKNTLNDFTFFKELNTEQQKKIIKELREINKIIRVEKPYRITLLDTDMPVLFKSIAMKKINSLRYIDPGNGEYYKLKNWVDTFMRIPFSKYNSLPISIEDGVDKCHDFMENAQKTINEAVYGLNEAKMQIMQMLGQLLTNPKSIGSAIAIHGPPGTGKTSLIKDGISKILNRPFAFIALGGATDSSFLEGHSYTYEGSTWGKIIQIIIDSKCMNPVIYFDELDKISDTPKGEEIAGILTHLTDTSQNNQFHDKYFSEVDFDLSKCLFIFSYNDETKVNPILRDRMYKIKTSGYDKKQKMIISNNYLLPKIREQINFKLDEIIITDEAINHIIENNCNNEDGVRNLKRCLEIIYTKLNLYRLMKPGTNLFEQDMTLKVEFPFTVTKTIVDKLIKSKDENQIFKYLYV
jgi:ATP-dependent Lon protease